MISFSNPDELARAAAGAWLDDIQSARQAGKPIALRFPAAGSPKNFLPPQLNKPGLAWHPSMQVEFFWADERCVPPTDPESNFKLADELLFAPLKIAESTSIGCAVKFRRRKRSSIARAELGANRSNQSPTASQCWIWCCWEWVRTVMSLPFFQTPRRQIWDTTASFLVIENSPKPPPTRISLSFAAIVAARKVWVLASGAGKADALRAIAESCWKNAACPGAFRRDPPKNLFRYCRDLTFVTKWLIIFQKLGAKKVTGKG